MLLNNVTFLCFTGLMANYKGHIAGAAVSCGLYVAGASLLPGDVLGETAGLLSDWQMVAALFIVAMLFGLWPDIDTNSKGQSLFYAIAFATDVLLIVAGRFEAAAYLGLLAMTPIVGKHRGWTHSLPAMILVPLPILLIPYLNNRYILPTTCLFYGAAVVGYFSHLLLDGRIIRSLRLKT